MNLPTFRVSLCILILMKLGVAWSQGEDKIWSHKAKSHFGELATVCGVIVAIRQERQPYHPIFTQKPNNIGSVNSPIIERTILYFDKLPPHHEFFAVIKDVDLKSFPSEVESYMEQKACVYGKIQRYNGRLAIAVFRPGQIAISANEKDGH